LILPLQNKSKIGSKEPENRQNLKFEGGPFMKSCPFKNARHLLSTLEEVPPFRSHNGAILPEVALVGRSNVGKSSLLNHLLHRKDLARVSARPGKTYTINYFDVDDQVIIVDLPGYGYAKRPGELKALWSRAIDHYLEKRSSLALVLLLLDSRRTPAEEDLALIEWAKFHKKPLLLIFTKCDRLEKSEKTADVEGVSSVSYSIKDSKSRDRLITTINRVLYG
jgi:GTP-binding protein